MHNKKLTFTQWNSLYQLLISGYSLQEAMMLIDENAISALDTTRFYDLYIENHHSYFYKQLKFFYANTELSNVIKHAISLTNFKKSLQKQFFQSIAYPFLIFIFSIVMLLFFTQSIIPQLTTNFDIQPGFFQVIMLLPKLMQYFGIVVLCGIFFIILMYLFTRAIYYTFIQKVIQKTFLIHLHSYYFLGYYEILVACGLSSKQCIEYLVGLKPYRIFAIMMNKMLEKLNQGDTLYHCIQQEALLSRECKFSFSMAIQTNKTALFLNQGKQICENKLKQSIKYITSIIQIISYSFVIIIVVMMYQMMLLPLEMINQF